MKKLVCIAILMLNILGYIALANDPVNISPLAKKAFDKHFPEAQFISWKELPSENLYLVRFVYNNQSLLAYIDAEEGVLATLRSISKEQLPLTAQRAIKEKYAGFELNEITELIVNDGLSYLVNMKNNKLNIVIRVYANGEVHEVKKEKNRD